jgi:hypothetical protein
MAMKETSDGNSPLWQGAGKSFWTLPIFGSTATAYHDVFWKSDRCIRFISSGGLYRQRGGIRGGARWPHTRAAWARGWPRCPGVWAPGALPPTLLRISGSFRVKYDIRNLFCPISRIFPVYHFWNTKIAENRKLALWRLVNRLVPENA